MDELEYEIHALSEENKSSFQRFFRKKRFELILTELKTLAKKIDHRSKVLDIGCGPGIVAMRLENEGFVMTGSDYNKKFVDYGNKESGRKKMNVKFYTSDITKNFKNFNNKFDIVIASEVLEHVKDYNEAVFNLKKYLKKGGYLVITIPNFHGLAGISEFLWSLKARYNWFHEHKHDICCPKRMKIILENAGMKPLRIYTAFYLSHFVPFISEKFSSFIFEKEQKYMRNMGFGELIITISEKL